MLKLISFIIKKLDSNDKSSVYVGLICQKKINLDFIDMKTAPPC